jgi:Na+/melibiose symporter-like transporter
LAAFLGGILSQRNQQGLSFLIAGLASAAGFVLALLVVREPRRQLVSPGAAPHALSRTLQNPGILVIGAFLFLWNFNPFSTAVLYMHMVEHMGFSEQFYGNATAVQALGSLVASLMYAIYCRRLSVMQLVHLSIATGVLATIAYWGLVGTRSALVISFIVGFVYMTSTMIQLDLAARVCDLVTAGTTFALLMALTNLAVSLSMVVGGSLYERLAGWRGYPFAFQVLVGVGALFTCFCWFLVPVIRRHCVPKA